MSRNDYIDLQLRTRVNPAVPQPGASPAPGSAGAAADAAVRLALARPVFDRLLLLLKHFVGVVDIAGHDAMISQIDSCREAIAAGTTTAGVVSDVDQFHRAWAAVIARLTHEQLAQRQEIATLVDLVREALAIVAGDGQSVQKELDHSMTRFQALVSIDDLAQLKQQLVSEVFSLRRLAEQRQSDWDARSRQFSARIQQLEEQIRATAEAGGVDALTGLANRGAFDRTVDEWVGEGRAFVLALIDLDHFKTVNDTHGHTAGDRAIKAVAQAIKAGIRGRDDSIARVGGDEFAVLFKNMTSTQAQTRMRMISTAVMVALKSERPSLTLTLSAGVCARVSGETAASVKERADRALYEAKQQGRNRVSIAPAPDPDALRPAAPPVQRTA
jgi:diguanylate cyclase